MRSDSSFSPLSFADNAFVDPALPDWLVPFNVFDQRISALLCSGHNRAPDQRGGFGRVRTNESRASGFADVAGSQSRPAHIPYPDTIIADRSPNKHLGFGTSVHRCLGAYILRVEARIVIGEFLAHIPEFELDRSRMAPWAPGQVAGMGTVPIVFEPGEPLHNEPINEGVQAWLEHAKANGSKV
jgi:hypothetical protein